MLPAGAREFPLLTTERLQLRAPRIEDAEPLSALLSIAEVTRFSNWPDAPKRIQVERFTRWMSKLLDSGKRCAWIIEERGSQTLVAAIRYNRFDKKWRYGVVGYEFLGGEQAAVPRGKRHRGSLPAPGGRLQEADRPTQSLSRTYCASAASFASVLAQSGFEPSSILQAHGTSPVIWP
jgi:hypothetical protein